MAPHTNNSFHKLRRIINYENTHVSLFRLRTGHCRLNSHLFTLGLHRTVMCEHCHVPETVSHFLINCPAFQPQRLKLHQATTMLGIQFNLSTFLTQDTAKLIETFVKETGKLL